MDDEQLNAIVKEISDKHHKIIDDWCKAYMAQLYQETGKIIKPGDFVLCEQVPTIHPFHSNTLVKKYWFEPKENFEEMVQRNT